MFRTMIPAATCLFAFAASTAQAQSSDELARQLSNPVASLISVPLQFNTNSGFGDGSGTQDYVNIQPVIPISISPDWNVISRTIIPLISQNDVVPGSGTQEGFGNITQSFFFSPKAPTSGGLIWGGGPVLTIPTAGDGLGADQWGAGVTGVVLKQFGQSTAGLLANHVWSVSHNDLYGETSASFIQPFYSYTTANATSYAVNTEASYDWVSGEWSVPINVTVSQLVPIGGFPVSLTIGARYWAEAPEGGPEGWGWRAGVTYLFPK
jgi:hypothetical protein